MYTWFREQGNQILSKVVEAVKIELFKEDDIFYGGLSFEKEAQSIVGVMKKKIISLILESGHPNRSLFKYIHEHITTYSFQQC